MRTAWYQFLILIAVFFAASQVSAKAQDINIRLREGCFKFNNGASCLQLGKTLGLRGPKFKSESIRAFNRGCTLKNQKCCEMTPKRQVASVSRSMTDGLETGNPLKLQVAGRDTYKLSRLNLRPYSSNLRRAVSGSAVQPIGKRPVVDGYRFTAVGPDSLWRHLGFRVGDVLLEVNGVPAKKISVLESAFLDLIKKDTMVYTLERNGRKIRITYFLDGPKG